MFKHAQTGLKLLALAAIVAVAITDLGLMLDADGSDHFGRHRRDYDADGSGFSGSADTCVTLTGEDECETCHDFRTGDTSQERCVALAGCVYYAVGVKPPKASDYSSDDDFCAAAPKADVGKGQTAVKTAVVRFELDLGVDILTIKADDLADVKAYFGKEIAEAGGFKFEDILTIYFIQTDADGKETRLRGRRETAPGPIQTEIILKEDSGFDVAKIDKAIKKTLEAGDLKLEVKVGGVTYTATVTIDDYGGVAVETVAVNDGDMPKSAKKDGGLSGGAIAGIVIGTLILVAVVVFIIVKKPCASGNKQISPAGGGRTPAY